MNLFRINDLLSYDRFYFDLLMEAAPMNDFKFVELYSSPFIFNKELSNGPEFSWEKLVDVVSS